MDEIAGYVNASFLQFLFVANFYLGVKLFSNGKFFFFSILCIVNLFIIYEVYDFFILMEETSATASNDYEFDENRDEILKGNKFGYFIYILFKYEEISALGIILFYMFIIDFFFIELKFFRSFFSGMVDFTFNLLTTIANIILPLLGMYDLQGYDISGYDKDGFDRNGYDRAGFNNKGWNKKGLHKETKTIYDPNGYGRTGYNKKGWNKKNLHKETKTIYDPNSYDRSGYDKKGWNKKKLHKETGTIYNPDGWNKDSIHEKTGNEATVLFNIIQTGHVEFPRTVIRLVIFILCIVGIIKSIKMFRSSNNAIVKPPTIFWKKIIYQLGNFMLLLAAIAFVYTIGLIIYLNLTNTDGVPVGMGLGFAIIFFFLGQGLKSTVQIIDDTGGDPPPRFIK